MPDIPTIEVFADEKRKTIQRQPQKYAVRPAPPKVEKASGSGSPLLSILQYLGGFLFAGVVLLFGNVLLIIGMMSGFGLLRRLNDEIALFFGVLLASLTFGTAWYASRRFIARGLRFVGYGVLAAGIIISLLFIGVVLLIRALSGASW